MDHSGYSGHWENRPQSDNFHYTEEEDNQQHYTSKDRNRRREDYRPETEYNLHTFKKPQSPGRSRKQGALRNLPPKYFEIQPYLDNILSDQITENKEVQRTLKDLRSLNEQMLSELHGAGNARYQPPVRGNDWDEIQRLIMQIINNSQNQNSEFKASLQHLKNLKDRTLQEDLDYYEEDDYVPQGGYQRRPPQYQRQDQRQRGGYRPFSQTFEPRTENQRRLMEEIMDLREENAHIRRRLGEQINKNKYLSDRVYDLEDENNSLARGRGGDRRDDRSYEEQFSRLNQRVRDADNQNHHLRQQLHNIRQRVARSPDEGGRNNYRKILDSLNRLKHENNELRKDTVELLETKGPGRSYQYSDTRQKHVDFAQGSSDGQYKRYNASYRNQASYY